MMTIHSATTRPRGSRKAATIALLIGLILLCAAITSVGLHQVTRFIDPTAVAVYLLFVAAAGYLLHQTWARATADPAEDPALITAYEGRARVLAYLATQYPAVLATNDPYLPDWWVLYLDTPAGQMSWHLREAHLRLFHHVDRVEPDDPRAMWDGHSTDEKHQRLSELIATTTDRK